MIQRTTQQYYFSSKKCLLVLSLYIWESVHGHLSQFQLINQNFVPEIPTGKHSRQLKSLSSCQKQGVTDFTLRTEKIYTEMFKSKNQTDCGWSSVHLSQGRQNSAKWKSNQAISLQNPPPVFLPLQLTDDCQLSDFIRS